MRRRRQRSPLLMRIVGISVLIHLIALPILAKYGAFKKLQKEFYDTRLVVLPPPAPEKEKPAVKRAQKAVRKPAQAAKKSAAATPHTRQAAQRSSLNQPKVVASAANAQGAGRGDEPT